LSIPYFEATQVALVQKKNVNSYQKASDFANKQVVVQQGSIQEEIARKQLNDAQITTVAQVPNGVLQVQTGKAEAIVLDSPVATGYAQNNPDLVIAKVKLKNKEDGSNVIVMPKGSKKLTKKINELIGEKKARGTIEKYLKKNSSLQDKAVKSK
jgi:polar amino acid transport system substrate-binding protein